MYAAPQPLRVGVHVRLVDLPGALARLQYRETRGTPRVPGEFRRVGAGYDIHLRAPERGGREVAAQRVRIDVQGERIARITRDGRPVEGAVRLEPEVLTSGDDAPGEDVRPVGLSEVPAVLRNAVLAAEDHRFLEHGGLDVRGVIRALWMNVRAARVVQGGSTITQQLVKSRLLSPERTMGRKLREAWLAILIERRHSKTEILEAYLNEVYLGHRGGIGVRGVGAAARAYWGKEVHQLTLGESAVIAGMIRAPNIYSPALDRRRARERRDAVLARMRELGMIQAAEHDRGRAEPIRVRAATASGQVAAYFTDHVRREVERHVEEETGGRRALQIVTTLDLPLQRAAEAAVTRGLDRLETGRADLRGDQSDRLQAALVAIDPATGEIRAMVGGRDYRQSQFNRAVLAARQPGSAFKPFVYLAALTPHEGRPPMTAASLVEDAPVTLVVNGKPWSPRNADGHYEGRVSVRRALEGSLNSATVRIAHAVGMRTVIATAQALGIRSGLEPLPAAALGAFEVTPLELARAYLAFASGGVRRDTTATAAVYAGGSEALWVAEEHAEPVLSPALAYLMTSLLQGVIRSGTGAGANVPAGVAGKTGTTNDGRDAWFVGYSSNLVTLVWVGFDSGRPHGLSGAQAALPIWSEFMRQALDTYPAVALAAPEGITVVDIDADSGERAGPSCPRVVREIFLAGTEPPLCREHQGVGEEIRRRFWDPFLDWFRRR
ncbi:MAG: PBP1A family penicillin-binding protein [Candidatus Rokubacteria bacterium]|nr:PBP1A family penicillin-binding protein [Candidatus Rokubacteria bacterium]